MKYGAVLNTWWPWRSSEPRPLSRAPLVEYVVAVVRPGPQQGDPPLPLSRAPLVEYVVAVVRPGPQQGDPPLPLSRAPLVEYVLAVALKRAGARLSLSHV